MITQSLDPPSSSLHAPFTNIITTQPRPNQVMKHIFGLTIATLARAATVSDQSTSHKNALFFRVSLPPISMIPCGLLNNTHSHWRHKDQVYNSSGWVSTLSFQIIPNNHTRNKNKSATGGARACYGPIFRPPNGTYSVASFPCGGVAFSESELLLHVYPPASR